MKSSKPNVKPFWRALLILYSLFMLWLLFVRSAGGIEGLSYQEQLGYNRNLRHFFTIGNYLWVVFHSDNAYLVRHCFINLAGNVLLFIPIGFLLPKVSKALRNFLRFFLLRFAIMLAVELLQLGTLLGSFDVDDLILHLSGMSLGFLLERIIRR